MKPTTLLASLIAIVALTSGVPAFAGPEEPSDIGGQCGGVAGFRCKAGLTCEFGNAASLYSDRLGSCSAKPQFCSTEYTPVCGSDGKTYRNECKAFRKGVKKHTPGRCAGSDD